MNFVIFSHNFLPQNDAEAFCGARFANALAEAGHSVQVVTMDWPEEVDASVVNEMMPSSVVVHRVPLHSQRRCLLPMLRYLSREWYAANIPYAVKKVKEVLANTEKPILVSRGNPEASHIVGYLCRRHAEKWVVHFSDPYPWFSSPMTEFMGRRWGRKFIKAADYCSVTCAEALRFFKETYGQVFENNREKFIVTTHVGEPMLKGTGMTLPGNPAAYKVAHCGFLSEGRGLSTIVKELSAAKADRPVQFIQFGSVSQLDQYKLAGFKQCQFIEQVGLREVSDVFQTADINLVSDLRTSLSYIPFLPSKFVYALFADKPLLAYTKRGSCMYNLSQRFPEAGIWFADMDEPGALERACVQILREKRLIDRRAIRKEFSRREIASSFIDAVGR